MKRFGLLGAVVFATAVHTSAATGNPHEHPLAPPPPALPTRALHDDPQVWVAGQLRAQLAVALPPIAGAAEASDDVVETMYRDFGLSGLFRIVDPKHYADIDLTKLAVDLDPKPWRDRGVEGLLRGHATIAHDRAHLELLFYVLPRGRLPSKLSPTLRRQFDLPKSEVYTAAHELGNEVVKAFTTVPTSFGSRLVFAASVGQRQKAIYRIDVDGQNLVRLQTDTHVAIAPAYGPDVDGNGALDIYYVGAREGGEFSLFRVGAPKPVLPDPNHVFSVAFGGSRSALAVGDAGQSDIFVGNADGTGLRRLTSGGLNTHPAWGPHGELAYVSTRTGNPQVYVDGRRVSTRGAFNMAPTWCNDPEGLKVVFMGRDGTPWDILSIEPLGGPTTMTRLTEGSGSNMYPACSPDGRQIAFFSTRGAGSGPGLYVMTSKGNGPKKIANVLGESLRWEGN